MGRMSLPFATSGFNQGQQGSMQPRHLNSASPPTRPTCSKSPSDEEVNSATRQIVSAAIDALHPRPNTSSRYRRHTIDGVPPHVVNVNSAQLDAMTGRFLERSMARLNSRPAPWRVARRGSCSGSLGMMGAGQPSLNRQVAAPGMMMQPQQQQSSRRQSLFMALDAEVEKQTRACLAAQGLQRKKQQGRKVSLLGNMSGV